MKPGLPGLDLGRCREILVVKPDEIGDFILATPFLRGLRASAPRASISLAVSPAVAELALACRHVDRVVVLTIQPQTRQLQLQASRPQDLEAVSMAMRERRFDLAVVPRFDFDRYGAGALARASNAAYVVGFSEQCTALKAHGNRGADALFYTHVLKREPTCHEVEQNLALLAFIGGRRSGTAVDLHLDPGHASAAAAVLQDARSRTGRKDFIAVAPGSSYPAKELPLDRLAPVVAAVAAQRGAGVLILGAPGQEALGAALEARLGAGALSLCGRLPLPVSAAIIARATALISMCSGPAHIAAAVGTPVVVFSCHPQGGDPTHFHAPERFRPWAPAGRALVIQPAAALPPCGPTCVSETSHCIAAIDAGATIARIDGFLQGLQSRAAPD